MTNKDLHTLATMPLRQAGRIVSVTGGGRELDLQLAFSPEEIERRLLEAGFLEGEEIEILHHGPIGKDPIAVKVGSSIVALRRHEARAVVVEKAQ